MYLNLFILYIVSTGTYVLDGTPIAIGAKSNS
jgi:hypothetical protein